MAVDFGVYDFDRFVDTSNSLNRQEYKLSQEELTKFSSIRFRLNIKDPSSFRRGNITKNSIIKQKEELSELYKILNKISTKTYDKLSSSIIEYFKKIDDVELYTELSEKMFEIVSSNGFYSNMYANLFNDMMNVNKHFKVLFMDKLNGYVNEINQLEYVSPNENYDKYCLYVKKVDSIESVTKFIIDCAKLNVCSVSDVMNLILSFQKSIIDNIDNKDKLIENEAYVNNIYLVVKEYSDFLSFNDEWEFVCRNIQFLKDESGSGKNNKIRFKLMDIDDLIKKLK